MNNTKKIMNAAILKQIRQGVVEYPQNVLLLTGGGPGTSSLTLGFYLYEQAFETRLLGYSQAIGVFIFFIGIAGMVIIRRITYRNYGM